jgi:hypothetical protein
MGEDLFIPPAPVATYAPSATVYACPRSSTRLMSHPSVPRQCSHHNGCKQFTFRPCADTMFAPATPCTRGVCARFHASAPPARASPTCLRLKSTPGPTRLRLVPPVRAPYDAFTPNAVALLPAGVRYRQHGRPVRARSHFPPAPPPATYTSTNI